MAAYIPPLQFNKKRGYPTIRYNETLVFCGGYLYVTEILANGNIRLECRSRHCHGDYLWTILHICICFMSHVGKLETTPGKIRNAQVDVKDTQPVEGFIHNPDIKICKGSCPYIEFYIGSGRIAEN